MRVVKNYDDSYLYRKTLDSHTKSMNLSTDRDFTMNLLQRFIQGDEAAFSSLYHLFIEELYAYGANFSIPEEILEDLIQDTFCHLYFNKDQYVNVQNLKSYLFRVLKNHIIDYHRKPKAHSFDDNELHFSFSISAEDEYIEKEEIKREEKRIKNLLETLSPQQREIIYLRYSEKMDYSEIADIMECSCEVVRKTVSRGILKMKKLSEVIGSAILFLQSII